MEKVYCCDTPSNNDALYALLANQKNNDPMAMMAAMNGGMNGQWNNPFIYLVWMMFAQRMWGNGDNGYNGGNQNAQIAALQNQMQDNHNSDLIMQGIGGNTNAIKDLATNLNCDFNTLQSCCCDVRNGIDKLAGQVGFSAERVINAVNMGDCRVIEALKDCCCTTQKELLRMEGASQLQMCQQTNVLQNGQRDLQVALDKGLATAAFETQRQTCDLINNQNANTQRLIDHLNQHWSNQDQRQIQDLKAELSQAKQTQEILAAMTHQNHCFSGYVATNNK